MQGCGRKNEYQMRGEICVRIYPEPGVEYPGQYMDSDRLCGLFCYDDIIKSYRSHMFYSTYLTHQGYIVCKIVWSKLGWRVPNLIITRHQCAQPLAQFLRCTLNNVTYFLVYTSASYALTNAGDIQTNLGHTTQTSCNHRHPYFLASPGLQQACMIWTYYK